MILLSFVALAVGVALLAVRSSAPALPLFEQTIEKSSQLAVRWIVVLVFALALLASELGLDLLLGGFAAGLITRQVLKEREVPGFDSKLTAVAFGVFVPFFFVVSGMQLDVAALFSSGARRAKMFLFFGLFLVVRGTPALVLYRDVLNRARPALARALPSTQLPLVLAITTVARETGNMQPDDRGLAGLRRGRSPPSSSRCSASSCGVRPRSRGRRRRSSRRDQPQVAHPGAVRAHRRGGGGRPRGGDGVRARRAGLAARRVDQRGGSLARRVRGAARGRPRPVRARLGRRAGRGPVLGGREVRAAGGAAGSRDRARRAA